MELFFMRSIEEVLAQHPVELVLAILQSGEDDGVIRESFHRLLKTGRQM